MQDTTDETFDEFQLVRALVGVHAGQEVCIAYPLPANSRDFRITLTADACHRFRVRSCNDAGCSGFSNTLGFTAS